MAGLKYGLQRRIIVSLFSRLCVQAFTKVFESSKAHSAIKLSCLSAMAEILLSVMSSNLASYS